MYEEDLSLEAYNADWKYTMFEMGHSFPEIERMTIEQIGIVTSVRNERHKAEKSLKEEQENS